MPAGRPKKEKEQAAGDAPATPPPAVKVVGMLPFDEAAVALGVTKKALRERLDAGMFASARIGDDTYVLPQVSLGGRIASSLMELRSATERIASTLEALGAAAPATPPPTGTYGEQVDAQVERAIARIENAEGDWGLFSQFLQPKWKPLPDVVYHHLRMETAAEVEEYDVQLAIPFARHRRLESRQSEVRVEGGGAAERRVRWGLPGERCGVPL